MDKAPIVFYYRTSDLQDEDSMKPIIPPGRCAVIPRTGELVRYGDIIYCVRSICWDIAIEGETAVSVGLEERETGSALANSNGTGKHRGVA